MRNSEFSANHLLHSTTVLHTQTPSARYVSVQMYFEAQRAEHVKRVAVRRALVRAVKWAGVVVFILPAVIGYLSASLFV